MEFNHQPRKKNILKSSFTAGVCRIANILLGMVYRMIFLHYLSVEYLGLNGLFSNILGVLSLAELGFSSAIDYRLYKPISMEDCTRVGELMRFYRKVYGWVALTIFLLGLSLIPFLLFFIKETGEIPKDINIYFVFLLFLLQSSTSYLFSFKFALLVADQRQYKLSIIRLISSFLCTLMQIAVLVLWEKYIFTLVAGILFHFFFNMVSSIWITKKYPNVFAVNSDISREETKDIYHESIAALFHKVGGTIINSTDSILITKFIGLLATGLYMNYAAILVGAKNMVNVLFGSFTASLGNAHASLSGKERFEVFRRSLFLNFWIVGLFTACLLVLADDFIVLWLGREYRMDSLTVILLCVMFFLEEVRSIAVSYTNVSGLFVRDKYRPLIEASMNLLISIVGLKWIGIAGVFLGTIASTVLTVFWREPYLLYHYVFKKSTVKYWVEYAKYVVITGLAAFLAISLKTVLFGDMVSLFSWFVSALVTILLYEGLHFLVYIRNDCFNHFVKMLRHGKGKNEK